MKVFLSWSGERSHLLASLLHEWLPDVLQPISPWISDEDIPKGKLWGRELSASLEAHDVGILCVTHENCETPWMAFEAGALSKALDNSRVCPLLFGLSPEELAGPIACFQATVFEQRDLLTLVRQLNKRLGESEVEDARLVKQFNRVWPELAARVERVGSMPIRGDSDTMRRVISTFSRTASTRARLCSVAHFNSGFESAGIYESAAEIARSRMLVWGRKNRKLFDKEQRAFFEGLAERIRGGFDLRLLFLDPHAPEHVLREAHHDSDFPTQLAACVRNAATLLERNGIDPASHCRTYSTHRPLHLIAVDDAIMFTPIKIGPHGCAQELTKCSFCVTNSSVGYGAELLESFEQQWAAGQVLKPDLCA